MLMCPMSYWAQWWFTQLLLGSGRMRRTAMCGFVWALSGCQVSIESYCDQQEIARCELFRRCGISSTALDCAAQTSGEDCLASFRSDLQAGLLKYDASAAYQCTQGIRDLSCNEIQSSPESCREVVTGLKVQGERCGACAKGLTCARNETSCGTCEPWPARPAKAEIGKDCTPSSRNNPCVDHAACIFSKCVALQPLDAPCGDALCDSGLYCDFDQGKCRRLPDRGDACAGPSLGCKLGLNCIEGLCALRVPLGGMCSGNECDRGNCVNGVCVPFGANGEPCDQLRICKSSLTCRDGACTTLPQAGEPCLNLECAAPNRCVDGYCSDAAAECR